MDDTSVSDALGSIRPATAPAEEARQWLVLTHHLPAKPAYLRVKVHRRLERIGSVALKNSVYVLPVNEEALEDFQWLRQEIEVGGGEATLSVARFLDPETDERLIRAFREARAADYRALTDAAERAIEELRGHDEDRGGAPGATPAHRLRDRLAALLAIDFFEVPERTEAEQAIGALEAMMDAVGHGDVHVPGPRVVQPGRTWVTRAGVKVDRISSAWLIRRFIDPEATFKFVSPRGYSPEPGELRFDMFEGEFTHVGDSCTFETLASHFDIDAPAVGAIAEIVHDIDIKDDRFGRPETAGIASFVRGIARATSSDEERLRLGWTVLDGLFESLR